MDCDVSSVANCVISDTLGVPDVTKKDWFKHSKEKLETMRSPYSGCLHFELSGIGESTEEKEKLRSWKKNCGFCKVKRPRSGFCKVEKKQKLDEELGQNVESSVPETRDQHDVESSSAFAHIKSWTVNGIENVSRKFSSYIVSLDEKGTHLGFH